MSKKIEEMNLHQKLHGIMSEVGVVAKDGNNTFHKYKYASEANYIRAVQPLLSKYRVTVLPKVVHQQNHPENPEMVQIVMQYTLINIDDPIDRETVEVPAAGADKGDKGIYKAITGAKKYMFANTFMIETGDDPEADHLDYNQQKPKSEGVKRTKSFHSSEKPKPAGFKK